MLFHFGRPDSSISFHASYTLTIPFSKSIFSHFKERKIQRIHCQKEATCKAGGLLPNVIFLATLLLDNLRYSKSYWAIAGLNH